MEYPKEAMEIMRAMWNGGDHFKDQQWIKKRYNEIVGVALEDGTEQIDESAEQYEEKMQRSLSMIRQQVKQLAKEARNSVSMLERRQEKLSERFHCW